MRFGIKTAEETGRRNCRKDRISKWLLRGKGLRGTNSNAEQDSQRSQVFCSFMSLLPHREFLYQLAQPHGLPEALDILQGQEPGLFPLRPKAFACRPQDE